MNTTTEASPEPSPAATAARSMTRVAIAGLTRAGLAHATVLATIPDVELSAVSDPRSRPRRSLRGMGHRVSEFARFEKLLAKTSPAAVIVAAPQAERGALVRAALEAGAAVLVEAPMAVTAEEAAGLAALAAEKGARLAVSQPLFWQPVFAQARQAVRAGALGKPRQARASLYLSRVFNPRDFRRLGTPLAGGVIAHHALDLIAFVTDLFGPVAEVSAEWKCLHGTVEDELHAMMTLAEGGEVGLDASWSVPGHPRAATVIEVAGEGGTLLVSDDAVELDLREPRGGFLRGHTGLRDGDLPQRARFDLEGEERWLEDAAFLSWVAGGPPPPGEAAPAVRAQRVMEAMYGAARAGAPVRVDA